MPKHKSIILEPGFRIGKLTFVCDVPNVGKARRAIVKCDCGGTKEMPFFKFYYGEVKTCGCAQRAWWAAGTVRKHGMFGTPTYNTWRAMIVRCHSPKSPGFAYYGARGITVCQEWRESFEAKLRLVGRAYELLKGEVEVWRMQTLEIIVVLLILFELVAALRAGH